MAITFQNSVIQSVGTSNTLVASTDASTTLTIMGLSVTNITKSVIEISVLLEDSGSNLGYYLKNTLLTPNTSLRVVNGGERLILTNSNNLYVVSNMDASVDVIVSYASQV
jgi:hypothetical protein